MVLPFLYQHGDIFPPVQWLASITDKSMAKCPYLYILILIKSTDTDYTGGCLFRMLLYGKLLR